MATVVTTVAALVVENPSEMAVASVAIMVTTVAITEEAKGQ